MASIKSSQTFTIDNDTTVADLQSWFQAHLPSSAKLSLDTTYHVDTETQKTVARNALVATWSIESS